MALFSHARHAFQIMESETERKESTTELDVFHDEPHNPILNAEESSFFNSDSLVPSSAMPPAGSAYRHLDTIYLHNLELSVVFGPDAWNRPDRPQPIILSLQLQIDNTSAGNVDDIRNTFSYSQICKDVMAKLDSKTFMSIDHLTSELAGLADNWPGEELKMQAMAPKAMLRVEGGFGREFSLKRIETKTHGFKTLNWHVGSHEWVIKGLKLACIIGVNHHERLEKQNISIDIHIQGEAEVADYSLQIKGGFETWRQLVKRTCDVSSSAHPYPMHKQVLTLGILKITGCRTLHLPNARGARSTDSQDCSRILPCAPNHGAH